MRCLPGAGGMTRPALLAFAGVLGLSWLLTVAGMVLAWMESPAWHLHLAASLPVVAVMAAAVRPGLFSLEPESRARRACIVFAFGFLAGLLLAAAMLAASLEDGFGCGAFDPLCAAVTGWHVSAIAAFVTFGVIFAGELPFAGAALALVLPEGRGYTALAGALAATGTCLAALFGWALGHA